MSEMLNVADIWNCCQLYKDRSLFQHLSNQPSGRKLISAAKNLPQRDKIITASTPTPSLSVQTLVFFDDVRSHELDVSAGKYWHSPSHIAFQVLYGCCCWILRPGVNICVAKLIPSISSVLMR